ncbi:MAG: FapA family protein [Fretibacterium sp.]|nr:FapA family protein [Fretibacterium sp.]
MAATLNLEANNEGVWLSAPDGPFTPADVTQEDIYALLKSHGIRKYDLKAIEFFLHAKTGEPCKIAFRNPAHENNAKITVSLSKDNMTASVLIEAPFFTKPWPTEGNVLKALKEKAVIFGIDKEAIREMLENRRCEEYVEVARGQPPVEGKDAFIEFYIDPDKPFVVHEDEKIDYWSRSMLVTVHPGQEVAVKHPLEAGKNGLSVIGTPVKAATVKNTEFAFGEGLAKAKNNPLLLVATADGQLKNQKGKLVVLPELDVPGDVDFGIGSIDFTGAVRIRGSVRSGFHVAAQGNIDVHGMVEGADIDSQDSVTIHGGVRAMGKGSVRANGDVSVNFADQATIRSGGNIIVKNAILHSHLYAQKSVQVLGSGKKSQIAGGRIEAGLEVSCHVLGSEMGTKTEVVVGLPPEQIEKQRTLQSEVKRCEENLERVEPNLAHLKKLEAAGHLDDQKRAMLMNLTKMKFQLQAALESMKIEVNDLEYQLGSLHNRGIVRVKEICYSGVTISIRGIFYHVQNDCKYTSFIVDEPTGTIVLCPFDYVMSNKKD